MTPASMGTVLRQAREVREMSAVDAARAAGISAAYLSKLEGDSDLMRLSGYPLPGERRDAPADTIGAALFVDLTEDERDELLEYLAWYRSRRRSGRSSVLGLDNGTDVR